MQWENERYARVYTRDTADWLALSFDAQALLVLIMRKLDRAGRLSLGRQGKRAVAVVLQQTAIWKARIEPALEELLVDGCFVIDSDTLLMRNYVEAQKAVSSGTLRQRKWRENKKEPVDETSTESRRVETERNGARRGVTPSGTVLSGAVLSGTDQKTTKQQKLREGVATLPDLAPLNGSGRASESRTTPNGVDISVAPAVADTGQLKTAATWGSYSEAYLARYGVEPKRNASVNGQLAQLVKRLGAEEAPPVAAFYVGHAGAYYATQGHSVRALLRDAEKLHTEWKTGRQITGTQARLEERTHANSEGWSELLREKPA